MIESVDGVFLPFSLESSRRVNLPGCQENNTKKIKKIKSVDRLYICAMLLVIIIILSSDVPFGVYSWIIFSIFYEQKEIVAKKKK